MNYLGSISVHGPHGTPIGFRMGAPRVASASLPFDSRFKFLRCTFDENKNPRSLVLDFFNFRRN